MDAFAIDMKGNNNPWFYLTRCDVKCGEKIHFLMGRLSGNVQRKENARSENTNDHIQLPRYPHLRMQLSRSLEYCFTRKLNENGMIVEENGKVDCWRTGWYPVQRRLGISTLRSSDNYAISFILSPFNTWNYRCSKDVSDWGYSLVLHERPNGSTSSPTKSFKSNWIQ